MSSFERFTEIKTKLLELSLAVAPDDEIGVYCDALNEMGGYLKIFPIYDTRGVFFDFEIYLRLNEHHEEVQVHSPSILGSESMNFAQFKKLHEGIFGRFSPFFSENN